MPTTPYHDLPGMKGVPGYWRDETSNLAPAVEAYFNHMVEKTPITQQQIERVAAYLDYHIHAPCWDQTCKNHFESDLAELRQRAKTVNSVEGITRYIREAMEIGLDPL